MLVSVVRAQKVVHASLGSCSKPAQGTNLVHAHLSTLDDNVATINVGLDNRHGAVIEVASVRVIGGAAEQFDIEGAFFAVFQAETCYKLGALNNAYAKVIEGSIIINVGGLGDETIIGNYKDACIMSLLENIGHG